MRYLILCLALSGCATSVKFEAEHISHPSDGWPTEAQYHSEDELNQVSVLLHWKRDRWYADAGIGVNVLGKNGSGFYGSPLTGTVRVGYELPLR